MRQSLQVQRRREKNEGDFASVPVGRFKLMILDLLYSSSSREIEGEERGDGTAAATNVATPRATSKAHSIINRYNVLLLGRGAGAANDAYCHHLVLEPGRFLSKNRDVLASFSSSSTSLRILFSACLYTYCIIVLSFFFWRRNN
jgi:hypothetical protein